MEHLFPEIREIVLLPSEERIKKLRDTFWVGYGRAEEILRELEDILTCPRKVRMPNALIVGPTNNGKSMIIEKFRRQHVSYGSQNKENEIVPIVCIQMPSNPTLKRFYGMITHALGAPIANYGVIARMERKALQLLEETQVKVLVIDEIHNILAGNTQQQREFLNVLRFLGNELRLSIAGVGTKEAYFAIRSDEQLENRFSPFPLPLWQDDLDFMRLLDSFQKILPLQKPSNLLDVDVRRLILTQSEGKIGEIAKLLTQAACEAIRSGEECINYSTFGKISYRSPMERRRSFENILH